MIKRIIIHWTGGVYQPNEKEYNSYHFLINGDGLTIKGKYTPQDNENCSDGRYAAHTGGGNTGSIGVTLCGMLGYQEGKPNSTKYPLKEKQCEACWKKVAELCKLYGLKINPETVMTHFEFGLKHPNTTSKGKIDIVYLPPYPKEHKYHIGEFIRNKVLWYYQRL